MIRYYTGINNILSAKVEAVIPIEAWEILGCFIMTLLGQYCHLSHLSETTSHFPCGDRITTEFQPEHFYIMDVSEIHGNVLHTKQ